MRSVGDVCDEHQSGNLDALRQGRYELKKSAAADETHEVVALSHADCFFDGKGLSTGTDDCSGSIGGF